MSDDQAVEQLEARRCDSCYEPGTSADLPLHGECMLRAMFGGIADILTPEDVADVGPDGGMSVRDSARCVECLLSKFAVDSVLRREHLDTALEIRRQALALLQALVTRNYDALQKLDPKAAAMVAVRHGMRDALDELRPHLEALGLDDDDEEKTS